MTLKEAAFEQSSALCHATELHQLVLSQNMTDKLILCVYTDGGPDHRVTYLMVKIALVCLFLQLDLDYLIAARTAPCHSWRNPVERIMSTLNLGLQCVGLQHHAGDDRFESEAKNCNSLKDQIFGEQHKNVLNSVKRLLTVLHLSRLC